MKKLLTFISFQFLLLSLKAQHCPFDGAALIALTIQAADSNGIISGLKIYMLDSTGKPVKGYRYANNQWVNDTVWFWQNPERTTFKGYIDNNNPAQNDKIRFPFARNNYVTVVHDHFPLSKCKIVIAGINKGKRSFKTKIITLKDTDVYPLCTTYNDEVYNCPFRKIIYAPADIILAGE
ncbi:MAG TPA: hypothetical protein VNY73_02795 [Bacteroidia bacterium]|jgi:hypothetical protein|nr:hypothetical protein [Bacteroidia bacterium]